MGFLWADPGETAGKCQNKLALEAPKAYMEYSDEFADICKNVVFSDETCKVVSSLPKKYDPINGST